MSHSELDGVDTIVTDSGGESPSPEPPVSATTENGSDETSTTDSGGKSNGTLPSKEAMGSFERVLRIKDAAQREQAISKLESSGRKEQLEVANMLREKFPKAVVSNEPSDVEIEIAVEKKLKALGLNANEIAEYKREKEDNTRLDIIKRSLADKGANDDPESILRSREFIIAYNNEAYEGLSVEDKTELALKKALKAVTPAKYKSGGMPQSGKEAGSVPIWKQKWHGKTLSELS